MFTNYKSFVRHWLLLFLFLLPFYAYSQTYLLDVGVEQYLPVPETSIGYVDHAVWACESPNITFVKKDAAGAIIKINSYFDKAVTVELVYVVKYLDKKGFTRQYTGYTYYNIQCNGSAPTVIPSVLTLKVGETYQLKVSSVEDQSTVEWEAWNPPIVRVSESGLVTARKEGTGIIFATVPGLASPLTCTVYVKDTKMSLKTNIQPGFVDRGTEISLSSNKTTAEIYYTVDGSSPEDNGELYTNPIVVDKDVTLKAIAFDPDGEKEPSDIFVGDYMLKIVRLSATSDAKGLASGTEVHINSMPSEANVYYTIDGSEPTTSSILYSSPIPIREDCVLKAIGYCDGFEESEILVMNYRIAPEPQQILITPNPFEVTMGHSGQLYYSFIPSDAETLSLKWDSSDISIATVNQQGEVTARQPGQTTITVTTHNGIEGKVDVIVLEPYYRFFVWLCNGEKHSYDCEEHPEVIFGESEFTLTTDNQTIQYQASDIRRFTIQEVEKEETIPTTIPDLPDINNKVVFSNATIHISKSKINSPVRIFDMMGRLVLSARTDNEGNLSLPLSSLQNGIYIVKTETTTIKIQKR